MANKDVLLTQPVAPVEISTGTSAVAGIPAQTILRARWPVVVGIALLLGGVGAGGYYWWAHRVPALPPGIAFSNGRLEADQIDIATKFAGRIARILVDEGTMVRAGQTVAQLDTRDLEAQLAQAMAQTNQARQSIVQSQASLEQMGSQLTLTVQELQRARALAEQGYGTRETLDQRQSQFNVAVAAYHETEAKIAAAIAGVEAATHKATLIQVNIADNILVAPKDGPIEYRLSNVGEVLAAGGKVFTMLDIGYVYMDVFMPTLTAGRLKLGDDAVILLDAWPARPIPASVSFIAAANQFTPKAVETKSERDKLMFRIRVRIDPKLLHEHEAEIRSGLPGLAYIRFDPNTAWPTALQPAALTPAALTPAATR